MFKILDAYPGYTSSAWRARRGVGRLMPDIVEKVAVRRISTILSNNDSRTLVLLNKYFQLYCQSGHNISTEECWPTFSTQSAVSRRSYRASRGSDRPPMPV
jgi:hypothetical protein